MLPQNFFDLLNQLHGQDASSAPDPLEGVNGPMKWLKNEVAVQTKARKVEDDLFAPENLHLTTDEYGVKVNQERESELLAKQNADKANTIQQGAYQLNADAMLNQINQARQILGQAPLLPDKADLKDPSSMQAILAAIGAFMFPQHAFDIAATPFQNRLAEQQQDQARLDQAHAEQLRRAGIEANLSVAAGEAQQRANELNFQANVDRETRKDEQAFQKEVIGINFENALTMEASGFDRQIKLLDKSQQHQIGMFFLQNALDPSVGPEVRSAAQQKLKGMGIEIAPVQGSSAAAGIASGLGIDPQQLAGMTLPELNQFVGLSLALKDEKRRSDLFPEQKRQLEQQGKLIDVQVKFASGMARLQYDLGKMSLLNTQSEIDNRTWLQNYNTEEQQRLRLGQLGQMYQGSRDALTSQYIANSKTISDNNKLLTDKALTISAADKKRLTEENTQLLNQNQDILKAINSVDKDYEGVADRFRSQLGIDVEGSGNGEAFLGTPYSWGGGSLTGPTQGIGKGSGTVGFDCSGLTRAVANLDYGVKIPRTAKEQWEANTGLFTITTTLSGDAIEGDFLYFRDGDNWHTGILVYHVENNELVAYIRHAPQTGAEVRDDRLEDFLNSTSKKFVGIRRVLKNSPNPK